MSNSEADHILTVNAGSSSIKIGLFEAGDNPKKVFEGVVENIGQPSSSFIVKSEADSSTTSVVAPDHQVATRILVGWLKTQLPDRAVSAIGHRIVHGGPKYYEPHAVDSELVAGLRELTLFDPEHLPVEIQLIEALQKLFPDVKQVACFDTAFHHDLPTEARLLPIPRHYEKQGIRRYGFHGLSYEYVLHELKNLEGKTADGRLVIAHLGSGASLAAIKDGESIDTTMGLTPASGVPMSTRSGDLDPGLALYLAKSEGQSADQFNDMVNYKSGLLGVSETTPDMKSLLEHEAEDSRSKDAVDVFCYQVRKSIGSFAAALGGLDGLVFTGGMGENAPKIRARVCDGLGFLGISIEDSRNATNDSVISADGSQVIVRVIHTDEAMTIARNVSGILQGEH